MDALAFQLTLKSDTVKLPDIGRFLGKKVMITIAEVEPDKPQQARIWKQLGMANFGGKLHTTNIRDLAYE